MKRWKILFSALAVSFALAMPGCSADVSVQTTAENRTVAAEPASDAANTGLASTTETETEIADIPAYSGSPYVELSGGVPAFSDEDKANTEAFEYYSDLDSLGRCGVAYANICPELQPTEERGSIGQIKPSGWHTVKYSDIIEDRYLYNRCHLIGYQLAGENANEKNLITGTRYMNVDGMLPFENEVDDYVDSTGNHVLYRVTPIFEGDNLVASGVEMEAWSVEDSGGGVCFHVYCYNVQPGIEIDYATGDSRVADETADTDTEAVQSEEMSDSEEVTDAEEAADAEEVTDAEEAADAEAATGAEKITESTDSESDEKETDYILNTNTKKFHLPSCSSVDQMSESNKKEYTGTADELIEQGYSPCGRCLKNLK